MTATQSPSVTLTPLSLQTLPGKILEVLIQLATTTTEKPECGGVTAIIRDLRTLLPEEHRAEFNEDMAQCIELITQSQFDLSPKTIATNILPHYANFLATQIVRSLINYSAHGVPDCLTITVRDDYLAVAEIKWLYSVVDAVGATT